MILWLTLFLLIVAISFLLAFQSMRDYHNLSQGSKTEYGLFLIRHVLGLDTAFLEAIYEQLLGEDLVISIERLFKGSKSTLVIYGPKNILENFAQNLDLLELEDYSKEYESKNFLVWEAGVKDSNKLLKNPKKVFDTIPQLGMDEQLWWQVILTPSKGEDPEKLFQTQVRCALYSSNLAKRADILKSFQDHLKPSLVKIPQPLSSDQLLLFYQSRSLKKDTKGPVLSSQGVMNLTKL